MVDEDPLFCKCCTCQHRQTKPTIPLAPTHQPTVMSRTMFLSSLDWRHSKKGTPASSSLLRCLLHPLLAHLLRTHKSRCISHMETWTGSGACATWHMATTLQDCQALGTALAAHLFKLFHSFSHSSSHQTGALACSDPRAQTRIGPSAASLRFCWAWNSISHFHHLQVLIIPLLLP